MQPNMPMPNMGLFDLVKMIQQRTQGNKDAMGQGRDAMGQVSSGQPAPGAGGMPAAPSTGLNPAALLEQIFGNSGDTMMMGGGAGSVAPPVHGEMPNMSKYGEQGGERLFFGMGPNGATPISATPGLGQGAAMAGPTGQSGPPPVAAPRGAFPGMGPGNSMPGMDILGALMRGR